MMCKYTDCANEFTKAFKRSGHRYRIRSSGQRPRRCRSRAARRPYCRGRWCEEANLQSASVWDSPLCRAGRSSRRCRRTVSGEAFSLRAASQSCAKTRKQPRVENESSGTIKQASAVDGTYPSLLSSSLGSFPLRAAAAIFSSLSLSSPFFL